MSGGWTAIGSHSWSLWTARPRPCGGFGPWPFIRAASMLAPCRPDMSIQSKPGKVATWDHTFPEGWRHVAAVKQGGVLTLYVDGIPVATTNSFNPKRYDLNPNCPLLIGFGAHDYFKGALRDIPYLSPGPYTREIQNLAGE